MSVFEIREDAPPLVVEEAVLPPLMGDFLHKVTDNGVSIEALHLSEIRVNASRKVFDIAYADVAVPISDALLAPMHYGVVDVYAVELERRGDKFTALSVVLAVLLVGVHAIAIFGELFFGLGDVCKPLIFIGEHPPHIINESAIVDAANINLPMVVVV